jgi:hypothetical protein
VIPAWLDLIATHPVCAAFVLVGFVGTLTALWIVLAAACAAIAKGKYAGQVITVLDSIGVFAVSFVILCGVLAAFAI